MAVSTFIRAHFDRFRPPPWPRLINYHAPDLGPRLLFGLQPYCNGQPSWTIIPPIIPNHSPLTLVGSTQWKRAYHFSFAITFKDTQLIHSFALSLCMVLTIHTYHLQFDLVDKHADTWLVAIRRRSDNFHVTFKTEALRNFRGALYRIHKRGYRRRARIESMMCAVLEKRKHSRRSTSTCTDKFICV